MHRLLVLLLSAMAMVFSHAQERYARVRIALDEHPDGVQGLLALGICLDHSDYEPGKVIIAEVSYIELDLARAAGFELQVLVEDLAAYYAERAAASPGMAKEFGEPGCPGTTHYDAPAHFALGSQGGFFTWDEMQDQLDSMLAHFPALISPKASIGSSHEGRPIHMVRISSNPNTDQGKPEVLYDALHHAREPESAMQMIFFMWYLLENYGTDPLITYLLDERELFFVPCVNPDGYVHNQATNPAGGGMWRKNRRNNGDGTFGVDLNRNYGHQWGIDDSGSSPNPMSDTYRGPSPFSEPETQAMRDFIEGRSFVTKHSHHCRGHLLIHAWGWGPAPCPDCEVLEAYAQRMTKDNGFIYGDTHGVLNYYANGSATDWSYAEHGVLGYVPETGTLEDGFWPMPGRIVPLAQANLEQNLLLALFAGAYAEAEDTSPRAAAGPIVHADFRVKRYGQRQAPIEVSIEPLLNVVSTGAPVTFDALGVNESTVGSIPINLDPGMQSGERFRYVLATACDGLVQRDTIERVLGAPIVIFSDDCSTNDDWGGGWAMDPVEFASPPAAFADSPSGNYADFIENEWILALPLDLSQATSATLCFKAKWQLQSELDHVRVEGSSDGIAWTALCGRYSRQGYPMQGEGEPVYDGRRHEWTDERIVCDSFSGGPLYLRFGLASDGFLTYDGFHLDDVSVEITSGTVSGFAPSDARDEMSVHPVPASSIAYIDHASASTSDGMLMLRDAQGRLTMSLPITPGASRTEVDVASLANGMYVCTIEVKSVRLVGRLFVAH